VRGRGAELLPGLLETWARPRRKKKIRGLSVTFQILQDNPYLIISTLASETTSCIVNESVQITTPGRLHSEMTRLLHFFLLL
jgi:hypothetical protein